MRHGLNLKQLVRLRPSAIMGAAAVDVWLDLALRGGPGTSRSHC
jgi:hypothetical protein